MDGDLSLSQSFGGLRIANPDDLTTNPSEPTEEVLRMEPSVALQTPDPVSLTQPVHLRRSPSSAARLENSVIAKQESFVSANPQPAPGNLGLKGHHVSASFQSYPDASQSHPSASTNNIPGGPSSSTASHNGRPAVNGASVGATPRYRLRTESGASATSSTSRSRSDSRGGSAALQAGVPTLDNSHSDRSYKQSQAPSWNGNAPSRGSSRAAYSSVTVGQSGSPRDTESILVSSSEEWHERGAAVGMRQEVDPNGKTVTRYVKKGVRDFSFGRTLGEGSYSTVVAATDRQTLKEYAIKILDKRHIIKEKKVKYVNIEKDTLNRLTDHPGVVRLYYTFQDERSLYFVLDLCTGGELLGVLKRMSTFDVECARFYGAQILDTVDYMHRRGVIHRDLKPENVLLDSHMHVKITDFGTAKILPQPDPQDEPSSGIPRMDSSSIFDRTRANSFVGTAEYVSPELLTEKNACKSSDLWAFGCIIFQLLAGRPPFKGGNEYQTFQKIVGLEYEFPKGFPPVARDLVERLLVLDPASRLPIEHIKNHEFFDGVVWGRGLWKEKAPRLKPYVPPPSEPIKLNGTSNNMDSFPPNIANPGSSSPAHSGSIRPQPRLITELPPPSQLDIEWSPVLSRTNERILKMGNLTVLSSPAVHNTNNKGYADQEAPKKFSRFFGGSGTKRRQRLVMVTTGGRIIILPAGGADKRAKVDLSLLTPGTEYRCMIDAKGSQSWVVDTRDKHYVFEDGKSSSSGHGAPAFSNQEWIDILDRAKDIALLNPSDNYYLGDEAAPDFSSGVSSHANTLDLSEDLSSSSPAGSRGLLHKNPGSSDADSIRAKKRFSRRHSKHGLSAVF